MLLNSLDIIKSRVDLLESRIFGVNKQSLHTNEFISSKLQNLSTKVNNIDNEISNINVCLNFINDLRPLLSKRQSQLSLTLSYANELSSKRDIIIKAVDDLNYIQNISSTIINSEKLRDISNLKSNLNDLESRLLPLVNEIQNQSNEIDDLLDKYDYMVNYISELMIKWDLILTKVENEKH